MQSADISTADVDHAGPEFIVYNDNVVVEPKTLPELSNDVVIRKSSGSTLSLLESEADGVDEESLEREEASEDKEVDFVENRGSRAVLEGSQNLVEERESSSLKGERGSVNVEKNGAEDSDLRAVLGQSESSNVCGGENGKERGTSEPVIDCVDNQGSSGRSSFNSSAQQLFPKTVNQVIVGKQVMAAVGIDDSSTLIGNVVKVNEPSSVVENEAIGGIKDGVESDKENIGVNTTEGGYFDFKGELQNQAIGVTNNSVVSGEENIGDNVIEGGYFDSKSEPQNHVSEGGFSFPKGGSLVVNLDTSVTSHRNKSRKKGGFCTSDLVWGKVRSHPWWPAQIFEAEDASEQAKKHSRSKSYLVAYFGDQTFAWNDEAKLKPFALQFSQMAKQSTAEAFQHAVNCALDEAASRAEFGLSCHCIADEVYSRLKVQVIKNAGIREKICIREGRDRLYAASTFEPVKFLDYVKDLAVVPHIEDHTRLAHVAVHAQMSAFYRWKGCYLLAEFGQLIGYVNNEADAPVNSKKEEIHQMDEDVIRPQKRKKLSGNSGNSTKKVKHLSDLMCRKGKKDVGKEEDCEETEGKTDRKFVSSSVGRSKEAKLPSKKAKSKETSPQITPSRESNPGLRVGESILRAALQLSQSSPLLKLDVSSHGKTTKGNSKSKQTEAIFFKKSSPDVILSKFLLVAVDPLEEHSFLRSIIRFFSEFRDSVAQDIMFLQKDGDSSSYDIVGKSEERPSGSRPEGMGQGCSSGTNSEENGSICEIATQKAKVPELQTSLSEEEMVSLEGGSLDEDILQEESPTALTLKFTDMDSIPTEAKLNRIFSAFGPLKESETEVLAKKNCARVVFKRRRDAETAFSSSGKFETFGASLVCYQLNYAPSPRKSSSPEAKRRKDGTFVESIGA